MTTAELLSAVVLCASLVVTLVASLQQARHERRRAVALDERWAPQPGKAILDSATRTPLVRHEKRATHVISHELRARPVVGARSRDPSSRCLV